MPDIEAKTIDKEENKRIVGSKTIFNFTIPELFACILVVGGFLLGYFNLKSSVDTNKENTQKISETLEKVSTALSNQTIILQSILERDTALQSIVLKKQRVSEIVNPK